MASTTSATSTRSADLWADVKPAAARRMLLAAVDAFAAEGYSAATTRDIAERAGMSPAAVYVHYRSKADLLYAISLVGSQSSLDAVTAALEEETDPVQRLRGYVSAFVAWHAHNHTLARVIQYELKALTPEHFDEVDALRRRRAGLLRSELRRGARAGAFQIDDQATTALAILSMGIDVARWYTRSPSPRVLGTRYADLAVRLVGAHG
ncbi:TetR/AcrR family transcriptional regulator [Conexibacter woesei]|uniref:Transcriptional regulator, TetR family n=1 Tax=Conexibacter woesei (strain DSM 14684 / CCUG 47730 / CIP 108061 / JCM 11494 / NBRC 100937 / ID131577) TaxID=469383 RepID=D3F3Q1_CONWI|nr:TetR/AcrR family transcriptional regulator [Conexibacter woesei]ADB52416.1 transcriptional regulator, TetR family [Conexibacter woesei DSM 14684]